MSSTDPPAGGTPDHEPDYRFTLANERTYLAWVRTSLALLAAGVAVVQLIPAFPIPGVRSAIGGLLVALSVLTAAGGLVRWLRVERAMRQDHDLPRQRIPWILALGLVLLALIGLALVVTTGLA